LLTSSEHLSNAHEAGFLGEQPREASKNMLETKTQIKSPATILEKFNVLLQISNEEQKNERDARKQQPDSASP